MQSRFHLLAIISAFVLTNAHGQSQAKSAKAATPVTMTECEGTNNCATWTFLGTQGNGQWPSGEIANLSVERYDDTSVVIRRADSTGSAAGLTATYTGTRHGDQVGGEYTSSWPGHWQNKTGNWYATVEQTPAGLPTTMRFCGPAHCGTLTWSNGHYGAVYDDIKGTLPEDSIYTVALFKPEGILINRVDKSGGTAVLTGKLSPQGNSIIDGKITYTNTDGTSVTNPYQLTWGAAYSTATGPTRPQVQQGNRLPVICVPWFFSVICG